MTTLRLSSPNTVNETARQSKTHAARAMPKEIDWQWSAANWCPPWRTSHSKSARSSQTYTLLWNSWT